MRQFFNSVILLALFFSCCCPWGKAQETVTPTMEVINAIKDNHVSEMMKYFDARVPVTIDNNQAVYSRNQAEVVLRDFFERNNPRDIVVKENGATNDNSKFAICTFSCANGSYNVYILLRLKDKHYKLQEIRLNKE
jgi:Domain of unknown function (DUF4783)